MLMVVTTRPPFTYAFTTSLQYISILEKLYFLLFHVESNRFLTLLKFLSCYYWCGVVAVGGSARRKRKLLLLLLREGAYVLTLLPTNRAGKQVSKPCLFSLCLALVLSLKLSSKKNKNFGFVALPAVAVSTRAACHRRIVRCFPSLLQATTAPQKQRRSVAATRAKAAPQRCRNACCNSITTLPRHVLQQRRNAPATRVVTPPQRSRDTSCNIITLQACSAGAS
jgi:hypothetical protein